MVAKIGHGGGKESKGLLLLAGQEMSCPAEVFGETAVRRLLEAGVSQRQKLRCLPRVALVAREAHMLPWSMPPHPHLR